MDIRELYNLIEEYYGHRGEMLYIDTDKQEAVCMLYNAFVIKCSLNDQYGRFGAGIIFGKDETTITEFLGKRCSFNIDPQSIRNSLSIIENYCRLRLPDKFLEAYEQAYGNID